jgi:nucleoside-diphosphate-sugar epimerase
VALNAGDPDRIRDTAVRFGSPDVLVHCLSGSTGRDATSYRRTYVETLRHLLAILDPRFTVFTSSTSVYPQNDGARVTEESPTGGTPTGDVLLEAEQLALAAGGAAVRLGGIYGPGRTRFIEAALSGEPLPHGAPDACVNLIHRDDAARALFHVASQALAGTFNAVDDHPARRSDLAAAILSGSATIAPPPAGASGKIVSNARLRTTGWAPAYPSVPESLRRDPDLAVLRTPPASGQGN